MAKQNRRTTAEEVLRCVLGSLDNTKKYFSMDLSILICKAQARRRGHPQPASMARPEHPLDHQFLRLLRTRPIAIKEAQLYPRQTRKGRALLRRLNISEESRTLNDLKESRRNSRIEKGVGQPGILCILLPARSKLVHLAAGEETRLIQLLSQNEELLAAAKPLSPKLHRYQCWYDDDKGS
ncbi:uncharacterized protein BJX67DRAFT_33365 [Aspergillus lucknowensis]|uniref:Uncharacterized protein n=1 Tax=Aspergillus lucknowensis TaxID=176173 RepID=A0ABR4L5I6_9EURO